MPVSDLAIAAQELKPGISLVFVRQGETLLQCQGIGIRPLLELLENPRLLPLMHGSALADRVVGKAAALLALRGRVTGVYAPVMSRPAEGLLRRHGVPVAYRHMAPYIMNRTADSTCPMEQAVEHLWDPERAPGVLRQRLDELMAASRQPHGE